MKLRERFLWDGRRWGVGKQPPPPPLLRADRKGGGKPPPIFHLQKIGSPPAGQFTTSNHRFPDPILSNSGSVGTPPPIFHLRKMGGGSPPLLSEIPTGDPAVDNRACRRARVCGQPCWGLPAPPVDNRAHRRARVCGRPCGGCPGWVPPTRPPSPQQAAPPRL